jgi:hypothetical protein
MAAEIVLDETDLAALDAFDDSPVVAMASDSAASSARRASAAAEQGVILLDDDDDDNDDDHGDDAARDGTARAHRSEAAGSGASAGALQTAAIADEQWRKQAWRFSHLSIGIPAGHGMAARLTVTAVAARGAETRSARLLLSAPVLATLVGLTVPQVAAALVSISTMQHPQALPIVTKLRASLAAYSGPLDVLATESNLILKALLAAAMPPGSSPPGSEEAVAVSIQELPPSA